MVKLLERDGVEKTLAVSDRLTRWGFQLARESGASISPFIGESINRPAEPRQDAGLEAWDAYMKEMEEAIRSVDFSSNDLGPQVLAVRQVGVRCRDDTGLELPALSAGVDSAAGFNAGTRSRDQLMATVVCDVARFSSWA
jgi:hypothetical protein